MAWHCTEHEHENEEGRLDYEGWIMKVIRRGLLLKGAGLTRFYIANKLRV